MEIVGAENISLNYPEKVKLNEEFNIQLNLIDFLEDTYDVKLDLLFEGERIAEIFNENSWKSTYYYVNNIINNNERKDFLLRIQKEFTKGTIEVKIKNSADKVKTFYGYDISFDNTLLEEEEEETTSETSNENQSKIEEVIEEENLKDSHEEESITENTEENTKKELEIVELKPINLNAKNIKSEENNETWKKNISFYGIITFCFIFGIVFLLKGKRNKNEFRQ